MQQYENFVHYFLSDIPLKRLEEKRIEFLLITYPFLVNSNAILIGVLDTFHFSSLLKRMKECFHLYPACV